MKNETTKYMALNALVAGIYFTLVVIFQPLSFGVGPFTLRVADILLVLPWFNKKLGGGVVLGVLLSNLTSPLGLIDWVVGPSTTALAIFVSNRVSNKWLVPIIQGVITGLFIGLELSFVYSLPFLFNFATTAISTWVVCMVGIVFFSKTKMKEII